VYFLTSVAGVKHDQKKSKQKREDLRRY